MLKYIKSVGVKFMGLCVCVLFVCVMLVDGAYTNCDIQLQNVAPDDGLKSPKHVERLMINKDSL
jgi:hypothetical protein